MDQDTRDLITWTLGTLVSMSVLIGLAVRFVLLPYVKDHLVQPMKETHRQVSENGHTNASPTIPDRLEDLGAKVEEATEAHAKLSTDMGAVVRVVDEHLAWSERWTSLIDRELELVRDKLRQLHQHPPNGENGD